MKQQDSDHYIWQIHASNLEMVSRELDYEWLIGQIEDDVRRALAS